MQPDDLIDPGALAALEARAREILRRAVDELQADAEDLDRETLATILSDVAADLARADAFRAKD